MKTRMERGRLRLWRTPLHGLAVVCAALWLASPALPGRAEEPNPEFKQTANWIEVIRPGGTLKVRNPFGNVYTRFGGYEDRVEILATSQRLETDLPELRVDRRSGSTGLSIAVDFAGDGTAAVPPEGKTRDRVDLVLFVPQGVVLDVETRDGLIDVKKLKGDLFAASIRGDLTIKAVEGRVRAKTEHGTITAQLESGTTGELQDLVTSTGDIEVHVWEDARFDVELATSGEISTDFSLEIEHRRFEEPKKVARAVLGGGGPELVLRSKQGRVKLLRLQKDFRIGN